MRGLIGDRFLKRFFAGRPHQRRTNPDSLVEAAPEEDREKPAEPGSPGREEKRETKAHRGIEETGEINQLCDPENGSDRTASDARPPAIDDQEK